MKEDHSEEFKIAFLQHEFDSIKRQIKELRKGTKMISEDKLWEKVRYYNELSHIYSNLADELTAFIQNNTEEK